MTVAGGVIGKYCNSQNPVLILANQDADKKVITKDLKLNVGDVIQFKVSYRRHIRLKMFDLIITFIL